MKKLLFMLLIALSVVASAQITTYPTGNVNIKRSTEFTMNILSVGPHYNPSWFTNYQNGVHSFIVNTNGNYNIGMYGESGGTSNLGQGRSIGVLGVGGGTTNGYNYGVFGRLGGTLNGAGVFGTVNNNVGTNTYGRYAGYFDGPTYVSGTLTATNVVTPSDIRLKENVISIAESDGGKTLANVLGMNVIEYNYKVREIPEEEKDTIKQVSISDALQKEKHYGLVAQELQTIYPSLVKEGEDGYLGVNYVELVPVLIRSIQELNEKIEALEKGASRRSTTTLEIDGAISENVLYPNTPNPFKDQSVIRFSLANNVQNAEICIFDMTGKTLKRIPVSSGSNSITINSYELGEGIFLYSLIVNGKEIDTKKMVISKY